MKVDFEDNEVKVILEGADRETVKSLSEKINALSEDQMKQIDAVFLNDIKMIESDVSTFLIIEAIESGCQIFFSGKETSTLINFIINFARLNVVLEKLKEDLILNSKSRDFILNLGLRYGGIYRQIIILENDRNHWKRIKSSTVIDDNRLFLLSTIYTYDGQHFSFKSGVDDSLKLSDHFIRRLLEVFNTIDKEKVLEIDKKNLEKFLERVNELKTGYDALSKEFPLESPE